MRNGYNPATITRRAKWIRQDDWRGYFEPLWWVVGANDTGMESDSPCPSDVCKRELHDMRRKIRKELNTTLRIVCYDTSNVFCKHWYLIVAENDWDTVMKIARKHYDRDNTRLLYINEKERDDKAGV